MIARRAGRTIAVALLVVLTIAAGLIVGGLGLLYMLQLYKFLHPTL